ncbi:LuxR C-terminal-related transcriptional regulator [Cellulomonas sp. NPDC058312]|uniref:helix-turn-helix transcriptional regulator n=1 Tax=Cellulomonas sp. NPDC058312 TaxID=3346441 RepID=UPI0036E58DE8
MNRHNQVVRVALVLGDGLTGTAVAAALDSDPRLAVVHVGTGCTRAVVAVRPGAADVLVVEPTDLVDGTGVALAVRLQQRDPGLAVLLLGGDDVAVLARDAGAGAPRPWTSLARRSCPDPATLAQAVVATARGDAVRGAGALRAGPAGATPARVAVLRLVAQGLSNRAVARLLGLSPRSVENHLAATYRTLGIVGEDVNPRVTAVLALRSDGDG